MELNRKRLKRVAVVLGIIIALIALFVFLFQQPSIGVQNWGEWGEVNEEQTEIITTLWVDNPNPLGVALTGTAQVSYDLTLNDVKLADGEAQNLDVPPGNDTLTLSTELNNHRIPEWWVNFVQNNETISVTAEPQGTVDVVLLSASHGTTIDKTLLEDATPVSSALSQVAGGAEGEYTKTFSGDRIETQFASDLIDNQRLNELTSVGVSSEEITVGYEVQRGWTTWGEVSQERTVVYYHFLVHNPSEVVAIPAEPDNLGLTVNMNNVELFTAQEDDTTLQNPMEFSLSESLGKRVLTPGETKEIVYAIEMDNEKLDDWFVSHVQRDEQTDVRVEFQMVFDNGETIFRVPENSPVTYSCELQTGILVDGQNQETTCLQPESVPGVDTSESSSQNDDESTTTPTPTGTDTDVPTRNQMPTETETVVPTQTPTPTETETAVPTRTPTPIQEPPEAIIIAEPIEGEAPLEVTFDASRSSDPNNDIEEYVWRFKDGTAPARGETVTHTFRTAGEYEVELVVFDSEGNQDRDTVVINVESRIG